MPAELIYFGDPGIGLGADFERECARTLRDQLPDGYILATNVQLARGGGEFYECDAIVAAPGVCDILEMKCVRPEVFVDEDALRSSTGFFEDRILSLLNSKAKVLKSRREERPFPGGVRHRTVRIRTQVVVPSDTRINFNFGSHQKSRPVRTLAETVTKYQTLVTELQDFNDPTSRREIRNAWSAFRDASAKSRRRSHQFLGRFTIRRQLPSEKGMYEYLAVDEPPCQMEVLLREFPFDPALPTKELDQYLAAVARESRILMKVRHPYVACVIGHFQTGCSWVQVSDWFNGEHLENLWSTVANASIWDRMGIYIKVIQALQYCHEKGVFHRNLGAHSITISPDLSDLKLGGFDCALDASATSGSTGILKSRDPRLVAPEDLHTGSSPNSRLSDIFQAGVLLYRLLENGNWPFAGTLDFVTSGGSIRPFSQLTNDSQAKDLQALTLRMMNPNPLRRPELLSKIEPEIEDILGNIRSD